MAKRIQILDCTLRDGGLGLEDAAKNKLSEQSFSQDAIHEIIAQLERSALDIIELGSLEISKEDKRCFAIYPDIESISRMVPSGQNSGQMYAALYRGPDTPLENIPNWNPSLCEAVRVIIRYSELQKSLDFCAALSQKGYKVFVQPMLTMRYSEDEIQIMIDAANGMEAYALYFVDSYGYMQAEDIVSLYKKYDTGLNPAIRIGFHAHNNMNLAFANVLTFLNQQSDRDLIVDSCMLGMGQGAGNLQTEIIADHMNRHYGTAYHYGAILNACELIEEYWVKNIWGYSLTHLLPAIHKVAYKYSVALRNQYGLSYPEINYIFKNIPEELRHRYTTENTVKLLSIFGYPS